MKILAVDFVTSADATGSGVPRDGLAHIAMAGRSNVGKSTLINALVRRKAARTSAAPGKTRLANVFRVTLEGGAGGPGRWSFYLVDLPGYGYARGGDKAAAELREVAESYFAAMRERLRPERGDGVKPAEGRPPSESERGWGPASREKSRADATRTSALVFLLVDARHPGLASDIQAFEWLSAVAATPVVVATKIDKLSRAERARNLAELERIFGTPAVPVSAQSGEGLDELWRLIARWATGTDAANRKSRTRR